MLIHRDGKSRKPGNGDNLWTRDPASVHFCSTLSGIGRPHPFGPERIDWADVFGAIMGGFIAHRTEDNRLLLMVPPTHASWWGCA